MDIQHIFDAINRERYQDKKWGGISEHPHTIFEWIGIMEHELSEAKEAYFQRPAARKMLEEILQVVTVGIACMEQHGVFERGSCRADADSGQRRLRLMGRHRYYVKI